MRKWFFIGALWLTCASIAALAQGALPLDTFISPDEAFQFAYPQNYDLLVGERILTGTQGRHPGIPVCDFTTAMACVIYPIASDENTRFEAAGFSVHAVPGVSAESECLNYSDQLAKAPAPPAQLTSISINERTFRHLSSRKKVPGHIQAADLYRTFKQQKCYELHIEVSLAEEPGVQRTSASSSGANSLGDARADSARDSLRLILSTVVFER
jgi:hypothetical protein